MAAKLYVGNLPYSTTSEDLNQTFAQYGTVVSATVISDRDTNRSKGFGFVEMETEDQAKAAIEALHGKEFSGRTLVVTEARPREDRPAGESRGASNGGSFRKRSW